MHISSSKLLNLIWIIFFGNLVQVSFSDSRSTEVGLICGTSRPPPNTSYIPLFVREMEVLSQRVTANNWGYYAENSTQISIYGLAQCHQDLSNQDCLLCYAASRTRLPRCLPAISARIYYDGCFLRYDNYSFAHESVDPRTDRINCSSTVAAVSANQAGTFKRNAEALLDNLTSVAVLNGGHALREFNGVYGLAQCWRTVSRDGCRECLAKANREVRGCLPSSEGRALNAGCYLRYSTENFFRNASSNNSGNSGVNRTGRTIAIALTVGAFCMLSLFGAYAGYARARKRKQELKNLGQISNSYKKSNLNFKYEILEKATNYFDPSRKVGQGGAGSVYKGTLSDGKTIAVKRLFFNSRQWVDEFFNEVNLISGIEHKNLVKLLGCSIEGPESLLVYEFVPNRSLDQYLFDKNKIKILSWQERFDIIVGTAEGIDFLHGGSEMRIIHRDIKSSNILLDENLHPKIADFGLARLFAPDKTHLTTGIAGTLGYMAPEYLVKGQLTEKADVYSYGVLVLEIVCGRKNNAFAEDGCSLLQTVWKLYQSENLTDAVDRSLKGDFPEKEALRVLKVGLLCTQAHLTLRPPMANVVQMLTEEDCNIPTPRQPPFLNASMLAAGTLRSYSIRDLMSDALTKLEEVSYTSTESSSMQSSSSGHPRSEEMGSHRRLC